MALEVFANDGAATVSSGGTTAPSAGTVQTWTLSGSTLPAVSNSATPPTQCYVADVASGSESEKILITNISGSTATVTRGADGTTPVTHSAGFTIQNVVTRASLKALQSPGWLNVVSGYGADPTGITDSTTAINAALSACQAGGVVYIPGGGTFKISGTLTVPNDVTLLGDIASDFTAGSTITVANGANLNAVISDSTWASNGSNNSTAPRVIGLIINGNGTNQSAGIGVGIAMCPYRGEIFNCRVQNTRGDGIRITNLSENGSTITGTCVECKIIDNTIESPGLGVISSNLEGIAFRDSGASAVTDYWCTRNVVYGNPDTNGTGIWANSAGGAIISENHLYGTGTHGIYVTSSTETRIVDNYIEYFGQKTSSGACYGIYATDDGGGPGTVISGNVINIDVPISGNTFTSLYLTNPGSGDPAFYSLGPNMMYSAVAAATALTINNLGNAANFIVAMMAQNVNGFTSPYNINNFTTINGDPFSGHQQPSYASTMSVDPTQGTVITVVLAGNLTMDLPEFFPSGMVITFIFQQPSSGGTYNYTVTFASTGGGGSGAWQNVTFTTATGANAFSTVTFVSDGYDLTQGGSSSNVPLAGNATIAGYLGVDGLLSTVGGTDTSGTATASTPSLSTGVAAQLSTAQDVMLYADTHTATATLSIAIGPTSTPAYTIVASGTAPVSNLYSVRVPKSWYVKATFTSADVTFTQITC